MGNRKIRFGVVGIGGMGASHASKLFKNQIQNAVLTAVCDADNSHKNKFKCIPFFDNVENFLKENSLDAVIIATPHRSLIKLAKLALQNNINVKSSYMVNRYDPPWRLPFMRRNEIIVKIY